MEYDELSHEEQVQILLHRKKQYQADHLNHKLNLELLIHSGKQDEQTKVQIQIAEDALQTLEEAHAVVVQKLEELKGA